MTKPTIIRPIFQDLTEEELRQSDPSELDRLLNFTENAPFSSTPSFSMKHVYIEGLGEVTDYNALVLSRFKDKDGCLWITTQDGILNVTQLVNTVKEIIG